MRTVLLISLLFLVAPWLRSELVGETIHTTYWPGGRPRTEQAYRLNLSGERIPHGRHVTYHENGARSIEGIYRDGQRQGLWQWRDENGTEQAECRYENDVGQFVSRFPGGQVYLAGTYHGSRRSGIWTEYYTSGRKRLQGEYRDNRQHGIWTAWSDEDTPREMLSEWQDGERIR